MQKDPNKMTRSKKKSIVTAQMKSRCAMGRSDTIIDRISEIESIFEKN